MEPLGAVWHVLVDLALMRNPYGLAVLRSAAAAIAIMGIAALASMRFWTPPARFVRYAARVRLAYPALLVQLIVLAAIALEIRVEARVNEALQWDFTPFVHAIEGDAVAWIQSSLHNGPIGENLDGAMIVLYTWVAAQLSIFPFFILVFLGRPRSALLMAYAAAIVWSIGLVFYLFFPVWEVWMTSTPPYEYAPVRNLLTERSPSLADADVWRLSLNNNFPSLHVASTMAIAFACMRSTERWLGYTTLVAAIGVTLSTIYLGIHWILDVVAGVLLAWAGVAGADRWLRRYAPRVQDTGLATPESGGRATPAPAPPARAPSEPTGGVGLPARLDDA